MIHNSIEQSIIRFLRNTYKLKGYKFQDQNDDFVMNTEWILRELPITWTWKLEDHGKTLFPYSHYNQTLEDLGENLL